LMFFCLAGDLSVRIMLDKKCLISLAVWPDKLWLCKIANKTVIPNAYEHLRSSALVVKSPGSQHLFKPNGVYNFIR
jgi:hypothetical protein